MTKPKVSLHSLRLLCDIDHYIKQYDLRGEKIFSAASDVLDGAVFRHEVEELIRRRLLRVVPDGCGWDKDPGGAYTLHLTERAITVFWPDRVTAKGAICLK